MKKILWIFVALAVGGYFLNSNMESKAKREAQQAEANRIKEATQSAISEMVSRTGAIDDWESRLSKGESIRFEPILTIELEKVWLQKRPILFIGAIKDIATHSHTQYTVLVGRDSFGSFEHEYIFDTELQLSLLSDKKRIDSFLRKHPDLFKDYGLNNSVAVVARVNAIRTEHVSGEEGERQEVKIGDGALVDIVYVGGMQ